MSISMYQVSVPVFTHALGALAKVLAKGEANITERKIDPAVILSARLAPDMLPLTKQVQIATDNAKFAPSRLTGRDGAELRRQRADVSPSCRRGSPRRTDYLATFGAADLDGSEDRTIVRRSAAAS